MRSTGSVGIAEDANALLDDDHDEDAEPDDGQSHASEEDRSGCAQSPLVRNT